jgi:hypothetical protein
LTSVGQEPFKILENFTNDGRQRGLGPKNVVNQGRFRLASHDLPVEGSEGLIVTESPNSHFGFVKPETPAGKVTLRARTAGLVGRVQRFGASRGPFPAAWSDPSLPSSSVVLRAGPSKPDGVSVVANPDGSATIKIPARPLHPLAIGTNAAIVYRDTKTAAAAGVLKELARISLSAPAEVQDPTAAPEYRVVVSDPIGRLSDVTVVQLP